MDNRTGIDSIDNIIKVYFSCDLMLSHITEERKL